MSYSLQLTLIIILCIIGGALGFFLLTVLASLILTPFMIFKDTKRKCKIAIKNSKNKEEITIRAFGDVFEEILSDIWDWISEIFERTLIYLAHKSIAKDIRKEAKDIKSNWR